MRTRRAMARAVLHLTGLTVELSFVLMASSASAATIPVTTTNDELNLHDGCSMREALMTVNSPGSPSGDCKPPDAVNNVIALQRGKTYRLSLKGPDETGNQAGDLNVAGTVTNLAIAGHATIDATGLGDRLLSIAAGASVTISGLKLTGGYAPAVA